MDLVMNYEEAKSIVKEKGFKGLTEKLESMYGYDFYACSTAWYDADRFICKLKGTKGDLVIGWENIHVEVIR